MNSIVSSEFVEKNVLKNSIKSDLFDTSVMRFASDVYCARRVLSVALSDVYARCLVSMRVF